MSHPPRPVLAQAMTLFGASLWTGYALARLPGRALLHPIPTGLQPLAHPLAHGLLEGRR